MPICLSNASTERGRFAPAAGMPLGPILGMQGAPLATAAAAPVSSSPRYPNLAWDAASGTLVLRVGRQLDLTLCAAVQEIIQESQTNAALQGLLIDLSATRRICDSGLSMLLLLSRKVNHRLNHRVYITPCEPEVFRRLTRAGMLSYFRTLTPT